MKKEKPKKKKRLKASDDFNKMMNVVNKFPLTAPPIIKPKSSSAWTVSVK